jgi:protein-disulfide isomerase
VSLFPLAAWQSPREGAAMRNAILLCCLVLLGACAARAPAKTTGTSTIDAPAPTANALPVLHDDPRLGLDDAPITLVMWSDTSCKYCIKHYATFGGIILKYREKLRIVWKDAAYDAQGREEAIIGRVVYLAKGNKAFWTYAGGLLHDRAVGESPTALEAAAAVGVDSLTIAALRSQAEARVEASYAEGKRLHLKGYPTTFIDGEYILGAQKQPKYEAVIDAHLTEGAEIRARGIAAKDVYAELVRIHYRPLLDEKGEYVVDAEVWRVPVGTSPMRGPADAPVTLVTFVDFDCEFSKKLQPTLQKLISTYGDRIRVVYKFYAVPFHARAIPAATLALEARKQQGDKGFWAAHDKLFASAPKLSDDDLSTIATELGLDTKKVMSAIATHADDMALDEAAEAAEELGMDGTPATYVNGRLVPGAHKYETFQALVEEELTKAEALVKKGTPKAKVYETIIATGNAGPPPLPSIAVSDAPSRGAANAKVVVQVFGDFADPFTRQIMFPVRDKAGDLDPKTAALRSALDAYGDKVRIVFRHFPLSTNPRAEPVAELAIEAYKKKGDAVFWKLFEDVLKSAPALDDNDLEPIAVKYGLDWKHTQQVMFAHEYKAVIDRDVHDGTLAGVTGVPTFFINGRRLVGAMPFDIVKKRIDRAFAKAK